MVGYHQGSVVTIYEHAYHYISRLLGHLRWLAWNMFALGFLFIHNPVVESMKASEKTVERKINNSVEAKTQPCFIFSHPKMIPRVTLLNRHTHTRTHTHTYIYIRQQISLRKTLWVARQWIFCNNMSILFGFIFHDISSFMDYSIPNPSSLKTVVKLFNSCLEYNTVHAFPNSKKIFVRMWTL